MITDFNRGWLFWKWNDEDHKKTVNLPHDAMISEPRGLCINGANSGYFPGGRYLYQKTFEIAQEQIGKYIAVLFEGVYRCATIYLNKEKIAYHAYGYTEFQIDISEKVNVGTNTILVDADNSLEPNSRWYSGSGIYRPVSLIIQDKNHIEDVRIFTKSIQPAVLHISANQECDVEIRDGKKVVFTGKTGDIVIKNPKLWDDIEPNLYDVILKTATDEVAMKYGIRSISFSAETGVLVNGREVKFRGACIHHDNGLLGACEFADASDRRIRIMKEQGYNAIRSAHNPCSRAILDACDKYGMYVMDESFDMWYVPKTHHDYARDFWDNYESDIAAMIHKDRNHTSVIMYSIGNEIGEPGKPEGMELAKKQAALMRELDPTRIITFGANLMLMNFSIYKDQGEYKREPIKPEDNKDLLKKMGSSGSTGFNLLMGMIPKLMDNSMRGKKPGKMADELIKFIDILGLNYATSRYEQDFKRDPKRIYVGSETFPHSIVRNWELVKKYPQLIGDFVWTGWDYLGEAGTCGAWDYLEWGKYPILDGAGTIDVTGYPTAVMAYSQIEYGCRKSPYLAVKPVHMQGKKYLKGAWRMTNAIPSWDYPGFEGKKTGVEVYADAHQAELFLNGKSLGKKKLKLKKCEFKVPYQPGELLAKAYDETGKEIGSDHLKTAGTELILSVVAEKAALKANGQDLCFVNIELTDNAGNLKPSSDRKIHVEVKGESATLAGFGSAKGRTDEGYVSTDHETYFGRAQAVLRAGYQGGKTTLVISSEGLATRTIEVTVRP